jgi:hypothetical protein
VIVRCGDPWPYLEAAGVRAAERAARLAALLAPAATPLDPTTWRGIGHLAGVPEVTFVCLPDLADICAAEPAIVEVAVEPPDSPEVFVECSVDTAPAVEEDVGLRDLAPPRADDDGFIAWRDALGSARERLARLPPRDVAAGGAAAAALRGAQRRRLGAGRLPRLPRRGRRARRARQQQRRPRGRPAPSSSSPGRGCEPASAPICRVTLEAPEGVLRRPAGGRMRWHAGPFARSRAAAWRRFPAASRCSPGAVWRQRLPTVWRSGCASIAPSLDGWALHADVSASGDLAWRAGGVSRLLGALLRAARRSGEAALFEASGPVLWRRVEQQPRAVADRLLA